jgi:hypothetical protein
LAETGDEAIEDRLARGLRFVCCSLFGHGRLAGENQLRDVGEGDGIATCDALASELPDEIAEEEIHFIGGGEAVDVVEKLGGEGFGVDKGNLGSETVGVESAESRWSGSVAMIGINQHVTALAAGILELALIHGKLFWGHGLAFRKMEVVTQ